MYIAGLAYYAESAWIKGTIAGTTVTFPTAQQVDDDEWLHGSNDGQTLTDIVFEFDQEVGTLTSSQYIFEAASETEASLYAYWIRPSFSKEAPVAPEVVVAPEDLVTEEYALVYTDYDEKDASASVKVGFDGNNVYFQGLNSYLPQAWAKGTLTDGIVTLAGGQYFGAYGSYEMYLQEADYQFAYNAEAGTFTGEGLLYTYTGNQYADYYNNPVLKKVAEKAAMPANPAITALNNSQYGYYIRFNVPTVDVNGDGLVTSKLSYMIYTDVEKDVNPLTFTSATHQELTEDMTVIPYGFTENYDFYDTQIYLNDLYSSAWNKIGIKSIYTGGGETNETEIQWFDIKDYATPETGVDVTFDFNALDPETTPVSNSSHDGDITEDTDIVEGSVTLTVSPSTTGTANRYWSTNNGIQLRVYGGTLTFVVPEDEEPITKITFNNSKWNDGNSANSGEFDGNVWTGSAQTVVVNIAGNTQLNSIEVVLGEEDEEPVVEELVELPEGVETEVWTLEGSYATNQGSENVQKATEVAFDGADIYVKGLAYYFPESWIKGTIENDVATFPSGQFVGEDEYGKEYLLGSSDGQTIDDIYFTYDAEAQTLTSQNYILENGDSKTELSFYGYWSGVQLYAGEPIVLDPVQAPEDLVTETYVFKSQASVYSEDEEDDEATDEEPTFEPYQAQVQVGFDGDDLYIQGISSDYAEGWVKATKNEAGKYVIPANQFMGTWDVAGLGWYLYDYFFTAVNAETNELTDVVLSINEETGTITTDQLLALNGSKNSLYYYLLFNGAEFSKFVEVAATPANPEVVAFNPTSSYPNVQFNIPAEDVDGNAILESKLFYTIYYVKEGQTAQALVFETSLYDNDFNEDVTEVPYTHEGYDIYKGGSRVYLNQADVADWINIGVQSIYYGGNEVHKSNIVWLNEIGTGIDVINAKAQPTNYYDLQGRAVQNARKGLYIRQYTDAEGRVQTEKVLRK